MDEEYVGETLALKNKMSYEELTGMGTKTEPDTGGTKTGTKTPSSSKSVQEKFIGNYTNAMGDALIDSLKGIVKAVNNTALYDAGKLPGFDANAPLTEAYGQASIMGIESAAKHHAFLIEQAGLGNQSAMAGLNTSQAALKTAFTRGVSGFTSSQVLNPKYKKWFKKFAPGAIDSARVNINSIMGRNDNGEKMARATSSIHALLNGIATQRESEYNMWKTAASLGSTGGSGGYSGGSSGYGKEFNILGDFPEMTNFLMRNYDNFKEAGQEDEVKSVVEKLVKKLDGYVEDVGRNLDDNETEWLFGKLGNAK